MNDGQLRYKRLANYPFTTMNASGEGRQGLGIGLLSGEPAGWAESRAVQVVFGARPLLPVDGDFSALPIAGKTHAYVRGCFRGNQTPPHTTPLSLELLV